MVYDELESDKYYTVLLENVMDRNGETEKFMCDITIVEY